MNILFDTCVIVDVLQNRAPFCYDGQKLFVAVAERQINGFITAKAVTDIYYLTHRMTHDNQKTREILEGLFEFFTVLDTQASDCKNAVYSDIADYEDAVMCETAMRSRMDGIVTRNIKDYQKASVKIFSPNQMLEII